MVSLYLPLQDQLNTRNEGKKSLNDIQGNVNHPGQAIIESLLLYLSFRRQKCEDRIIIAFIKSVQILLLYIIYFPILIKFILVSDSLSEVLVL